MMLQNPLNQEMKTEEKMMRALWKNNVREIKELMEKDFNINELNVNIIYDIECTFKFYFIGGLKKNYFLVLYLRNYLN